VWRVLTAVLSLAFWAAVACLRVLLFFARSPVIGAQSVGEARRALASYRGAPEPRLSSLSEGVFELPGAADRDAPAVVYFTGTGETPHVPMAAFERLLAGSLARTGQRFVVEAPSGRGAYYGSSAFSARIWQRVEQLVANHPGPFVLVGFSRGALAALDVAARITEEQGKVASVLSFSPPLDTPLRWPHSIIAISRFEPLLERLSAALEALPGLLKLADWLVERIHLVFTARIQMEHDMHAAHEMQLALYDLRERGAITAGQRATREFRLLVEAHSRELELFAHGVAGVAARTPRFFALLCWGENDPWAPALASRARIERALVRENTPADRVVTHMFAGRGHALFREIHQPIAPCSELLDRVWREALAREESARGRKEKAQAFERALRDSALPTPRTDD
jgi:pimeloyl-ACP methyl ester carboxylesterase